MKRSVIAALFALLLTALAACTPAEEAPAQGGIDTGGIPLAVTGDETAAWPAEFADWDIPTPTGGTLTSGTNVTSREGKLVQGEAAVATLEVLDEGTVAAYCDALAEDGFTEKTPAAEGGGAIRTFEKTVEDETLRVDVTYDDGTLSIVADNSAVRTQKAALPKEPAAAWPEALAALPVFTAGTVDETLNLGNAVVPIYLIYFNGATEADVTAYYDRLKSEGFAMLDAAEPVSYEKVIDGKTYSVCLLFTDDGRLQYCVTAVAAA